MFSDRHTSSATPWSIIFDPYPCLPELLASSGMTTRTPIPRPSNVRTTLDASPLNDEKKSSEPLLLSSLRRSNTPWTKPLAYEVTCFDVSAVLEAVAAEYIFQVLLKNSASSDPILPIRSTKNGRIGSRVAPETNRFAHHSIKGESGASREAASNAGTSTFGGKGCKISCPFI